MTTNVKTEKKVTESGTKKEAKQEDLRIAYEIHTLTQILFRELAPTHPWATPEIPPAGFQPAAGPSPSPMTGVAPNWPTSVPWCW